VTTKVPDGERTMSGEAAFSAITLGAVQCRRSGLDERETSKCTCGGALVAVMALYSMCHSPPDHCSAWSFTPTLGKDRMGFVSADQSMEAGGVPTMQA
jgi:hypothetical protein